MHPFFYKKTAQYALLVLRKEKVFELFLFGLLFFFDGLFDELGLVVRRGNADKWFVWIEPMIVGNTIELSCDCESRNRAFGLAPFEPRRGEDFCDTQINKPFLFLPALRILYMTEDIIG